MLNIFVSIAQIPLIVYTYVSYLYVKNIISGTPAEPENSNYPKNGEIAIQYSDQSSPPGEGVPGYEDRRWDWQQRRGHADLYCQHTSAWMHRQVKAVEGIPNYLHTKLS